MKHLVLIPLFLLAPPAMAQEEPGWEAKKAALMRAYESNGNKMSGWGMFDATEPRVIKTDRIIPTPVDKPVQKPVQKAEEDDLNMEDLRKFSRRANYKTDICARHGLHKVATRDGKSWRCK